MQIQARPLVLGSLQDGKKHTLRVGVEAVGASLRTRIGGELKVVVGERTQETRAIVV